MFTELKQKVKIKILLFFVLLLSTSILSAQTAPGDIDNGLTIWFKSDEGTTLVGGRLSQWENQSNRADKVPFVSQGVANRRPNFIADEEGFNFNPGTLWESGRRSILPFNGVQYGRVISSQNNTMIGVTFHPGWGGPLISIGANSGATHQPVRAALALFGTRTRLDHTTNSDFGTAANRDRLEVFSTQKRIGHITTGIVGSTSRVVRENGEQIGSKNHTADAITTSSFGSLGVGDFRDNGNSSFAFLGSMAEIIVFNRDLRGVGTELQQVESYLALKYGITLDQTAAAQDYLASDGNTVMWDASAATAGYNNDIFGVGRDDDSELGQIKSKSVNADNIITMLALGESSDASNTPANYTFTDIQNLEFQTIANNNQAATWEAVDNPSGYELLQRRWQVSETGEIGDVQLNFNVADADFDVPDLLTGTDYYFIYDTNNDGFLADETPMTMTDLGGDVWQFTNLNFQDGMLFTLATAVNDPCNATTSGNLDTDGDDVSDICDLDDDNDGITDTDEGLTCTTGNGNFVVWGGSNPQQYSDGSGAGSMANMFVASGSPTNLSSAIFGAGITFVSEEPGLTGYFVDDVDQTNLTGAIADNDYAEYSFTTTANVYESVIDATFMSTNFGVPGSEEYSWGVAISDDGFATSTVISTDVLQENTGMINQVLDPTTYALAPSTTYTVRVYMYSAAATSLYWDDFALVINGCTGIDTNINGTPDHLDLDSDGDMCNDVDEGYANVMAPDTDDDGLADGGVNNPPTLANGGVDANGLVIAAGVTGNAYNTTPAMSGTPANTFQEAVRVSIDVGLTDVTASPGDVVTFSATATVETADSYLAGVPQYTILDNDLLNTTSYQWQENGVDLTENGVYFDTQTSALSISDTTGLIGNIYTLVVTHFANACAIETSSAVLLADPCDPAASGNPDNDGDGISNICDLDDDNDGITDTDEGLSCTAGNGNFVVWGGSNPQQYSDGSGAGSMANMFVASGSPTNLSSAIFGAGITFVSEEPGLTGYFVDDVDQTNLTGAIADNDYAEYSFTTTANVYESVIDATFMSTNFGVPGSEEYSWGVAISDDGFATSTVISTDVLQENTGMTNQVLDPTTYALAPSTTYTVRVYMYSAAAISLYWDDFALVINGCTGIDTNINGTPDHLDLDSDGDMCSDVDEGYTNLLIPDTDDDGIADGGVNNPPTLANGGVDANGLVIAAGVTGNAYDTTPAFTAGPTNTFQDALQVIVNTDPVDNPQCPGTATSLTATVSAETADGYMTGMPNYTTLDNDASAGINYQWQLAGANLSDGGVYSGTNTATLAISDNTGLAGGIYTLLVTHNDNACSVETRNVTLTTLDCDADLQVTKSVQSNAPAWSFDFTLAPPATAVVASPATGAGTASTDLTWSDLIPGTEYTISEDTTGLTGYTAGALSCAGVTDTDMDANNASVTFIAPTGDTNSPTTTFEIVCTITNQQWPDVVVTKDVAPAAVLAGGTVSFSITAENIGILPASGVEITELLPAGLNLVSATPSGSTTYDTASGVWTVGDLAAAASESLLVEAMLEPVAGVCAPEYVNTVNVTAQGEVDFDVSNHSDSATALYASMALAKELISVTDMGDKVNQAVYEFFVINNGAEDIQNVQIVDDLNLMLNTPFATDATLTVSSMVSGGALTVNPNFNGMSDQNLLAGTDTLPAGADAVVTLTIELTHGAYYGPFINTASVTGTSTSGLMVSDVSEDSGAGNRPLSQNTRVSTDPCIFDLPTSLRLATPTNPITLGWFSSQAQNGGVLFRWGTELEVSNAGFFIAEQGEDGAWRNLNADMIEAVGDSTKANHYTYFANNVAGRVFRFSDMSVHGKLTHHGPFDLGQDYGSKNTRTATDWDKINQQAEQRRLEREQQQREEMQRRLQQMGSPQGAMLKPAPQSHTMQARKAPQARINAPQARKKAPQGHTMSESTATEQSMLDKLLFGLVSLLVSDAHAMDVATFEIQQAGIYRVTHQNLMASGIDLRGIDKSRIGLQADNALTPLRVSTGASEQFDANAYIEFPARGKQTLYSGVNQYVLTLDEGQSLIEDNNAVVADKRASLSYLGEARYAPQNHYSHISPDAHDNWYAQSLRAISGPAQTTVTLNLADQASSLSSAQSFGGGASVLSGVQEKPTLRLTLWGGSAHGGNGVDKPDHRVQVMLNGTQVADARFDGIQRHVIEQPLASVAQGNNQVKIVLPKDHGYSFDFVNLDAVTLTYPRRYVAEQAGQSIVFSSYWDKFRVRELANQNIVVYRIDRGTKRGYQMTARGTQAADQTQCTAQGCMVVFAGSPETTQSDYFVATPSGIKTPPINIAVNADNLFTGQAKALLIAHPNFINTSSGVLEDYASDLAVIYGSADIVSTQAIYAEYSSHVEDAYAIYAYVQDAYAQRNTRHLIIVGGDTHDYHNNLGVGAQSFVPSLYMPISQNVLAVPSDAKYADVVNDDSIPDITVARLPVRSVSELTTLLNKRANYLAASYAHTSVFAADKQDNSSYSFKADAQSLLSKHFNSPWASSTVYLDDMTTTQASQTLSQKINQGTALVSYFGHSGTDRWAAGGGLFSSQDINNLSNHQRPTIVAQWGCYNTYYTNPEEDSMAQRWLLAGDQGAVTVMGATSYTRAATEKRMADLLYERLMQGMRLGDAVLSAKQVMASENPYQLDILLGWTILGPSDLTVN